MLFRGHVRLVVYFRNIFAYLRLSNFDFLLDNIDIDIVNKNGLTFYLKE
jgi:hypothetical protein